MVEKEKTTDYDCSRTSLVKKWKGKQFRLAHFLVALALVVGGLLVASYAYNQYSQSMATNQLIGYNMLYQNGIQTFDRGLPTISGIDEIVPVSEGTSVHCLDTVQGSIKILNWSIDTPLPLCINNDEVADWYAYVKVCGGYTPHDGVINVYQGKTGYVGTLKIAWEDLGKIEGTCCCELWKATVTVCEPFCLDSNQFPSVGEDFWISDQGEIPGKHVSACLVTCWSGCGEVDQNFQILSVQNN